MPEGCRALLQFALCLVERICVLSLYKRMDACAWNLFGWTKLGGWRSFAWWYLQSSEEICRDVIKNYKTAIVSELKIRKHLCKWVMTLKTTNTPVSGYTVAW